MPSALTSDAVIPIVQVRHNKVVIYDSYEGREYGGRSSALRALNMQEQRKKAYSGILSPGARKRMKKAISLFCQACPSRRIHNPLTHAIYDFKFAFLTLTISDANENHTASEAYKKVLKPLIRWLRRTKGVKFYIWVAELQKRGQIHYHVLLPDFIPWQYIRNKWNYLQFKAGFLDGYQEKYGGTNPNSIDIHSTKKIRNAEAYLSKYLTKGNDSSVYQHGKVWDCSENLKDCKFFEEEYEEEIYQAFCEARARGEMRRIDTDFCTILIFSKKPAHSYLPLHILQKFNQYMDLVRSYVRQPIEVEGQS